MDRYENILVAFNYCKFCLANETYPPYLFNTRIYSTLLIDNNCHHRWRGRYNEDTDLSLNVLKDGYCTLQFNAFLQEKATTQRIRGGNSQEFYDEEGTLNKSKMLEKMHPMLLLLFGGLIDGITTLITNHSKEINLSRKKT